MDLERADGVKAFSHVIDYAFKNKSFNFHEKFHKKIITGSEIPDILDTFGFTVNRILDEKNFPLLERDMPDLCADRVDYGLRDFTAKLGFSEKISNYISHLIVQMVVDADCLQLGLHR